MEDSGTVLEKEVTVSGPELRVDWDIQLTTNVARGFIVKTSQKTRRLNICTLDPSIVEAKVVDADDERGYYCEIIGKRAGKTTLILEDSGAVLEKEVNVSGPELRLDWDIRLTANVLRGFIVKTSQKTGKLNIRTLDPSIAEAKVIDANDERGYYCEIIGKRAGKTTLILEDSGTVLEKEVTVSGPDVNNIILNWDINLEQFNRVGFIVETNHRTGKLNLRTLDPSIAEAKVIDANDERGYYCEIIGKRAGKTTLILEDSGTVLEKEVNVNATTPLNKNLENYLYALESWYGYSEANGNYREIIDVYNSHSPLALGYKVQYSDEWCDTYVSAAAIKAGIVPLIGTECGCERHIEIFKSKGIWIEDGRITPQIGDIIVYNWNAFGQPNDGFSDHIGVVKSVQNGYIMVIEGNIDERVGYRKIPVGWGYIRGYARPNYGASATVTYPTDAGSESLYTLEQFRPMGVIKWKGYTYKYYSELVLPGTGLNIPGRHVDGGFVRDIDGYIAVANSQLEKGTIVPTPFGADGKVYDRTTTTADVIDIYIH
ncbi:MAG: CHAP domain-containing protein [Peptostreptococcaceae bacterium]|nr:CHAP domain-containing protein [Peptostreptococcaceae bacterium]